MDKIIIGPTNSNDVIIAAMVIGAVGLGYYMYNKKQEEKK